MGVSEKLRSIGWSVLDENMLKLLILVSSETEFKSIVLGQILI